MSEPVFFRTPAELRAWFDANHEAAAELVIGFYRKATGEATLTWSESVDEALCVGWIDGVRRGLDARSYCIRFTPRRKGSVWSAVNIAKIAELTSQGRMRPAGLKVAAERDPVKHPGYSYGRDAVEFDPDLRLRFEAAATAWDFFSAQPAGYRRRATVWVMGAKLLPTRERRLADLVDCSARGRRLDILTPAARGQT